MTLDTNVLYYGDNLPILRQFFPAESVDLVYLDPPFNSNRSYSAIFADESGRKSDAQIHAFEDSWHWGPTAEGHLAYLKNSALHGGAVPVGVSQLMAALEFGIGKTPMLAYLVEMAVRLIELHRVLKPTGALYLHCDPTASHYLKIVLDAVFGPDMFRNEVVWKRSDAHNDAAQGMKRLGRIHDVLLFYVKSDSYTFNTVRTPLPKETADKWYVHTDPDGRRWNYDNLTASKPGGDTSYEFNGVRPPKGRYWAYSRAKMDALLAEGRIVFKGSGMPYLKRYLDESKGVPLQDLWADISMLRAWGGGGERLGYPTQKPVALLERIIEASSNPGDIVLDPFCGCGTALVAAQKLDRRWIGIDITYLAVAVMRRRLMDSFGLPDVHVHGKPTEVEGARMLAEQGLEGRYQFQWWALDEVGATPRGEDKKKGADTGIDGRITFTGAGGELLQAIVSVKSGKPKADDVRVLKAVCEREGAAIGILVTLDEPTGPMRHEATIAGTFHSDVSGKDYPRIQILSAPDLLERGKRPELPPLVAAPYQKAEKVVPKVDQAVLFGDT